MAAPEVPEVPEVSFVPAPITKTGAYIGEFRIALITEEPDPSDEGGRYQRYRYVIDSNHRRMPQATRLSLREAKRFIGVNLPTAVVHLLTYREIK